MFCQFVVLDPPHDFTARRVLIMDILTLLAMLLAIALMAYLGVALMKPEWFS
jgi:K+-transporting ATPase KdpF subunit